MTPKKQRPQELTSVGFMLDTWCGKMFANFSYQDDKMLEVFLTSKAGSCSCCFMNALTRTMSRSLRQLEDPELPELLARDLIGHSCPRSNQFKGSCVHQLGESMLKVSLMLQGKTTLEDINNQEQAIELG